jgi:hypothetical protein
MGQKMVRFAQLGAARSRQDESIEVGEVGSERPSSGCNGVHFAWWGGWADLRLVVVSLSIPTDPSSLGIAGGWVGIDRGFSQL